eukprot:COSAG02_NODE_785_length_17228_cov_24.082141_11_plen_119_part_00
MYILVGVFATYYFLKAPKDWKEVAQARQEAVDVGTGAGNSTTEQGNILDAEATTDQLFDTEDSKPNKGEKTDKKKQKDGKNGKNGKGKGKTGKRKKSKGQGAKDFDNPVSNFDDEKGD